ncbi:hypothetical protein Tco_0185963 [Tanacetum coccineum]
MADANLHVPLDEIKVNKTLRFVEEPVEIMDREIKKLKRKKIALVKVRWNSKRGPEFTWEHEDQMRINTPAITSKVPYFVALVAPLGARAIVVKMALGAFGQRSPIRLPFACPHNEHWRHCLPS